MIDNIEAAESSLAKELSAMFGLPESMAKRAALKMLNGSDFKTAWVEAKQEQDLILSELVGNQTKRAKREREEMSERVYNKLKPGEQRPVAKMSGREGADLIAKLLNK